MFIKRLLIVWFVVMGMAQATSAQAKEEWHLAAIHAIDQPMLMNIALQCDEDERQSVRKYKELCDNQIEISQNDIDAAQLPYFKSMVTMQSAREIVNVYRQSWMQSLQRKLKQTALTGEPLSMTDEELSMQIEFQKTVAWQELDKYISDPRRIQDFMAQLDRIRAKSGYRTSINWNQFLR